MKKVTFCTDCKKVKRTDGVWTLIENLDFRSIFNDTSVVKAIKTKCPTCEEKI